jgi:hypothetical protein
MDSDSLRHVLAEVTIHHAFTPELPPFATLPAANDPRREFPEVALISEFHHEWLSFYRRDFAFQTAIATTGDRSASSVSEWSYRNWPWPSAPNRWERYGGVIDQQDADPAHRLGTPKLTGRVFGPAGVPLRFQPDWQQIRSFERLRLGENYSAFILAHAITGADLLPPIPSSS